MRENDNKNILWLLFDTMVGAFCATCTIQCILVLILNFDLSKKFF